MGSKRLPLIATGITITFGTSGWSCEIVDVDSLYEISRESVNASHQGTTSDHRKKPTKLKDNGTLSFSVFHDPGNLPPVDGDVETITIDYDSGEQDTFDGFCSNYSASGSLDERILADVEFTIDGKVTSSS